MYFIFVQLRTFYKGDTLLSQSNCPRNLSRIDLLLQSEAVQQFALWNQQLSQLLHLPTTLPPLPTPFKHYSQSPAPSCPAQPFKHVRIFCTLFGFRVGCVSRNFRVPHLMGGLQWAWCGKPLKKLHVATSPLPLSRCLSAFPANAIALMFRTEKATTIALKCRRRKGGGGQRRGKTGASCFVDNKHQSDWIVAIAFKKRRNVTVWKQFELELN